MSDRRACLLAALGEVAWADGILRPDEAKFFVDVVAELDLPLDEVSGVYRNVLVPGPVAELEIAELDDDDRRWVLGFGYLMAGVDGEVADTELAVLRELAERLGIAWDDAQALFQDAESMRAALANPRNGVGA
jgi:tellurite resistance protein